MLNRSLHGCHQRYQFISGNPPFPCRRPAKCSCCVHMDPIIDCSSSPKTHRSAADVLQMLGLCPYWFHHICCITILGTLLSAAGVSKRADIRLFDVFQTISFCSCDGAMAKGSEHLGLELPPRVVELWNFIQRCVPHKCFLLTGWFHVPWGCHHAFWSIDVKVSESYGSICFFLNQRKCSLRLCQDLH